MKISVVPSVTKYNLFVIDVQSTTFLIILHYDKHSVYSLHNSKYRSVLPKGSLNITIYQSYFYSDSYNHLYNILEQLIII